MATVYYERNVVGANLLTQLTTDILSSTDWTRPNAGSFATLFSCTTTRGAQMAIDLNTTAVTLNAFGMTAYRTHDGTTGVDPALAYLRHKRTTGGALATNTYHYILSCGKEHFFLSCEGPRPGETGPDSASYGSLRNYVFLNDLVPYHAGDTVPAVALGGTSTNVAANFTVSAHQVRASRNGADSMSWSPGHLTTLQFPTNALADTGATVLHEQRIASLDANNFYLAPYVFFDNTEGIRGRLASFFFAGWAIVDYPEAMSPPPVGQVVTYGGAPYKLLQVNRNDATSGEYGWGAFGYGKQDSTTRANNSPVVAVPYA